MQKGNEKNQDEQGTRRRKEKQGCVAFDAKRARDVCWLH
jgi:hypothetical protein